MSGQAFYPAQRADFSGNRGEAFGGPPVDKGTLLAGIPSEEHAKICASARVREFNRGEMVCLEGDPVQAVILLTSGVVKTTQVGLGGTEVILKLSVAGDLLGAVGLLSTGKHCGTALAFRTCRAYVWDSPTFRSLMERYPLLHQNIVRSLGRDLLELEERFREVATERVGPRVARQLIRLRSKLGRPVEGGIEVGISREELAQMTGTTLFTVSRLLSAWEVRGLVQARREAVVISDVGLLKTISEERDSA